MHKDYLTVKELADKMNVSRITVFNKIKSGQIKAEKIGRNYAIKKDDLVGIVYNDLTNKLKDEIDRSVTKVIEEYGDVLRKLGQE